MKRRRTRADCLREEVERIASLTTKLIVDAMQEGGLAQDEAECLVKYHDVWQQMLGARAYVDRVEAMKKMRGLLTMNPAHKNKETKK